MIRSLLLTTALVLGLAACTVVSGWSDLQKGDQDRQNNEDGGASSSGTSGTSGGTSGGTSSGSTSGGTSGGMTPPSNEIACGGRRCGAGLACCSLAGIEHDCVSSKAMCQSGATFIECRSPADCAGQPGKPICCWDLGIEDSSGDPSATCSASCAGTERYPICDRSIPRQCPANTTCRSATGSSQESIFACQ